jgi:predicted alpha/beta superfamily hydrolase
MRSRRSLRIGGGLALVLCLCDCGSERSSSPIPAEPAATQSPAPTPDTRPADSFAFASRSVGDTFQVYVAVPDQYRGDAGVRYPVVYLLDANWNFQAVRGVIGSLVRQGEMQPVILVSMCPIQALQDGYGGTAPARCRDLTPTAVADFPGSGHAAAFAAFLRNELIPHIDATYRTRRTADDRALVGHSLAGLFTWYAALHLGDVIHKFIPASASLFWDNHVMWDYEAAYSREHRDLPASVYSTVSTGEGPDMVEDRDQFVAVLGGRGYPGLSISTATYIGIEHNSSSGPAFREGLALLF